MSEQMQAIKPNKKEGSWACATLYMARTGRKKQYYTLYHEGSIRRFPHGGAYYFQYHCTLAMDYDKALDKAKKIVKKFEEKVFWDQVEFEIWEEPKRECIKTEFFGIEFNTSKDGKTQYGYIPSGSDFWTLWKENKEEIKSQGFWIQKTLEGWMIFYKLESLGIPNVR